MITARPQKKLEHARQYFREHLTQGDYHSESQTVAGEWFGRGVQRLGLDSTGPVTQAHFVNLCYNRHPITLNKLTVRNRSNRRVFYDFVVSAPKSVSIMAVTVGDDRIIAAHAAAAKLAMGELEKRAATRIRRGGARADRTTGEIVAASFRHDASRALDPTLHTHYVVFNATWDQVEGRWKALETGAMFDHTPFVTEVYRNALAAELMALGYQLRDTLNGFEILGVSEEIIARFSQRSHAIRQEEARLEAKLKAKLSNNARAAIAHSVRPKKLRNLNPEELIASQRARLSQAELEELKRLVPRTSPHHTAAERPVALRKAQSESIAEAAIDFARDHLFERQSVVERHKLLRVALVSVRGRLTLQELEAALSRRKEFIVVDGALTTESALREEQHMIALVNRGSGRHSPLAPGYSGGPGLTQEMRVALNQLLSNQDRVMALRGRAGTGKTTLLRELVRAIDKQYSVELFAPTASAVKVLKDHGFEEAKTVQWLLNMDGARDSMRGKVIIVDEAGMVSNRQMVALMELCESHRCRLILFGDSRQHGSVEAGDSLRILESQSSLKTAELKSVLRQVEGDYRKAITELSEGRGAQALLRLERMGAVTECGDEERYVKLAAEYVASLEAGKTALIVTPTWREAAQVTAELRTQLRAANRLARQETTVTVHHPLKWTLAQKRNCKNFEVGHILLFHGPTHDFSCGDWGRVVRVEANRLSVETNGQKIVSITKKQANCFDVAEERVIDVSPGDKLQIRANRKRDRLINGQIVTVKALDSKGAIRLEDGRTISPTFRAFAHGYAVTSYGSQSKTIDHVYAAIDSSSLNSAHMKQFYVSTSRGREKVRIFTNNLQFLREAVNRPGTRLSATELLNAERLRRVEHQSQKQVNRIRV